MQNKTVSLAGEWYFSLDENNIGEKEHWYETLFKDIVRIPGSLDENGIGHKVNEIDPFRLNRVYKYTGAAWYNNQVTISDDVFDKHITLSLERCMWKTDVWINGNYAGSENSLCTPHKYTLDGLLKQGENLISIRVDNSQAFDLGAMSHGYSDEVQTIWNGIVGRIELDIRSRVYLHGTEIYSDMECRTLTAKVRIKNSLMHSVDGDVKLSVYKQGSDEAVLCCHCPVSIAADKLYAIELKEQYDGKLYPWNEFEPNVYRAEISLEGHSIGMEEGFSDCRQVLFGIRSFKAQGPVFELNGKKTFLRGTHDAGNFPITGYPSMQVSDWKRIYSIAKSYGINHFRFHSWCPGEAAFTAADEAGIILQAELPLFGYTAPPLGRDLARDSFLKLELLRILEEYGNHPSFCMMCMGNELRGDYGLLTEFVELGKSIDSRHLYSAASNNAAEYSVGIKPNKGDEYYVAHEARMNGVRTLRRCEGAFNTEKPETVSDYTQSLAGIEVPTISHEVGQWEVYPDFDEIQKYTGVLKARNLGIFKESMKAKQLLHKNKDFVKASGMLAVLLYREEIERSLRTADYGGFQLLDMHDFPGQGTALVGWLDAFWDTKGLVEPQEFRNWCNHTVLLARLEKRVWRSDEIFSASVDLANYSCNDYCPMEVCWSLADGAGNLYSEGKFENSGKAVQGCLSHRGTAHAKLSAIKAASKLIFKVEARAIACENQWDIWVYPSAIDTSIPEDIFIFDSWNKDVQNALGNGGKVLLLPAEVKNSESMCFTPPFWNTQMFDNQRKTMGILCENHHPALADFPAEFHANWQWWELLADAKSIRINDLPAELEPIVSAIDHPLRNDRLGVIFEARVLQGKLLVCSLDLTRAADEYPVAAQLRLSLLDYMQSERFDPKVEIAPKLLEAILVKRTGSKLKELTRSIHASNTKYSSNVENILDSEYSNFWVTMGGRYPYVIDIELKESKSIKGFVYTPRQDGMKTGFISGYEIHITEEPGQYQKPAAAGCFENSFQTQEVLLDWQDDGFNVTRSKKGKYIRFVAVNGFDNDNEAAIGSLDIVIA